MIPDFSPFPRLLYSSLLMFLKNINPSITKYTLTFTNKNSLPLCEAQKKAAETSKLSSPY
jgi:hypothetical protein